MLNFFSNSICYECISWTNESTKNWWAWHKKLLCHTQLNTLWVFRVSKYTKKCLDDLTTFFMSTWWGDTKNMKEIEFSRWLFEGRLWQGKNVLPDGLNWLCFFAGSSKSHGENSISFIFLESSDKVDMKNIVKSSKHSFGYFNTH